MFDCQSCKVLDALESLDAANAQAWHLFQRLATRFAVDAGLMATIWQFYTRDCSEEDFEDWLDRLALIYDIMMPPKSEPPS